MEPALPGPSASGMSSVTANSRMIYAFARDGAIPGSRFWHRINHRTRTPTNSVWFAAVGAFLLAVPYLWNYTAYAAVTSIAVIGLYTAYVIPVFLRVRAGDSFEPGPWTLGRWGRPVGIIATAWVAFIRPWSRADFSPDNFAMPNPPCRPFSSFSAPSSPRCR